MTVLFFSTPDENAAPIISAARSASSPTYDPIDTSNAKIISEKRSILNIESLSITYSDEYDRQGTKTCSAFQLDQNYLITQGECCSGRIFKLVQIFNLKLNMQTDNLPFASRNKKFFKENFGFIKIDNKSKPFEQIETDRAKCENLKCESDVGTNKQKDDFCLIEKTPPIHVSNLYPCDGSQNIGSQCWSFAYEIETRKSCLISITSSDVSECQGLNL